MIAFTEQINIPFNNLLIHRDASSFKHPWYITEVQEKYHWLKEPISIIVINRENELRGYISFEAAQC